MKRQLRTLLQILFAFVNVFLSGVVVLSVHAIVHFKSDIITGVVFFVASFCLVLLFGKFFPPVYPRALFWNKRIFISAGDGAVYVNDVAAAQEWYLEKLGLPYSCSEEKESDMELGYSAEAVVVCLVKISGKDRPNRIQGRPPIMFASKLADAHKCLSARGVDVRLIQSDSGGSQFFRFRDFDGNELEVCQDH